MTEEITNITEDQDTKIFGLFTTKELETLKNEFLVNQNTDQTVRKLLTPIFQKHNIRCFDELKMCDDIETVEMMETIKTMFYNLQMNVLVEKKEETTSEIAHLKGDPIRDENGNPKIDPTNQTKVLTYKKTEYKTRMVDAPIYNPKREYQTLNSIIEGVSIPPNFNELRRQYNAPEKVSYERGCNIIRELTKYYIFEEPEKFVDRFSLLICNAKSKALGIHPKYPVVFSLVGDYNTGKSWLSTMLRKTYDEIFNTRSQKSNLKHLLESSFNGIMMTRGFIALDEKHGGDASHCEKMKSWTTDEFVEISMKYKEDRTVRNLVTFLSTTNESIKTLMGLQKDRRIVEFVLKDKTMNIPEELMYSLLHELWQVMPCEHPDPDRVVKELLGESEIVLDATMEQIVGDLFHKHRLCDPTTSLNFDFLRSGKRLNTPAFKNAIKDLKYGRHEAIWNWVLSKKLIKAWSNGTYHLDEDKLRTFLHEQFPDEYCEDIQPVNSNILECNINEV